MAEELGMIDAIDQAVLRQACVQLRAWRELAPGEGLTVSVNVSGRQFRNPELFEQLNEIVRASGADPSWLRFEVTEGVLIEHSERVIETLTRQRALGSKISLDDFGTGYSSLSYLHRFPIDTIKIDKSFVQRMVEDQGSAEIVRATVHLAHNLGKDVVAEGVETAEQLSLLAQWGCDFAQGHYFSRAVPAEEAGRLLARSLHPEAA
jgi:EAL domain-containing protein (putative c-di-GMP-specific phosphodiesterase class I)